jgi:branched-chain amino acid transport system ATP-binding protein
MALLETLDVTVRFGGVTALNAVAVSAEEGAVTGLIGPNGAGKTTLFNVVTGLQSASAGRILIDGRDVTSLPVHQRARLGIARTFQRLELFGSLTVRENVTAAGQIRRLWSRQRGDVEHEAEAILERVGLLELADVPAHTLPTGLARLTELGRALATRPRLLLLDEPGSGLDQAESEAFGRLLASLAAEGTGVLLVEHDMDLVMAACSWIHVLDFGIHLMSGTPAEVRADARVQEAYLGRSDDDHPLGIDETAATLELGATR